MLCRQEKSSSHVLGEFVKDRGCVDELFKGALSDICTVSGTDYFQVHCQLLHNILQFVSDFLLAKRGKDWRQASTQKYPCRSITTSDLLGTLRRRLEFLRGILYLE
ncbi:hypothetical protein CHARACLAT_015836 [Characodon lateralis]|uniref:Uncharacterized protein n=1 Tax=Characodon lateralis TaxID=208331 RepID=A0ABU7CRZ9_9TELE|nr:hypothetical protein [Characodon lateralis]